jgi:hypothetical protein
VAQIGDSATDEGTVLIDTDGLLAEAALVLVRIEASTGDDSGDWAAYYGQGY